MKFKEQMGELRRHLMTGVSYMIPVVVAGGLLISIAVIIGGTGVWDQKGTTLATSLRDIGLTGLQLIVPVIACFIAYSIADRAAIAPALICGMLAFKLGTGFIGGIVVGLLVGYLVEWLKQIKVRASLMPLLAILIIPVFSSLVIGLLLIFVIGTPITSLMAGITAWLNSMKGTNIVILSVILGLMMAFDMGGPINKTAYTFALASFSIQAYAVSSAVFIAISIPPLGLALATLLAPKKYTDAEKEAGKSGILMGIIGITEGAIPFAVSDPFRVIPSIMIGSGVACGLSAAFGVVNKTVMSSVMGIPFVNKPVFHIIAVLAGCLVTAILLNVLKKDIKIENDEVNTVNNTF
ncbi:MULTISPECIES: PTS fructose transporter subunit IIC [Clostridium]|uniref:PTS fructose transporter subunit IIC n=1 Tax=Clostridium frigoriphilum TaxID=443253 RepID=A0ABU7UUT9_9CLOT|nr:PTS fructose transporter subunit IIC [Clostridium sp. DSM 17811]MBU3101982.1 PTS fructose transporter subunit IIC [Clostridium sp. DSM 17811]